MRSQPFTASARETTPTNLLVKCIIPFCQHIPIPTGELNIANLYKNNVLVHSGKLVASCRPLRGVGLVWQT